MSAKSLEIFLKKNFWTNVSQIIQNQQHNFKQEEDEQEFEMNVSISN